MEIAVPTQTAAWVETVRLILAKGNVVSPRGMPVLELPHRYSVLILRPQDGFVHPSGRVLNHAITAIEGTSLVGQCSVPELITDRVGAFAPYANDGIFWGAYGPRAAGDVGEVVDLLRRDPDSRQAVITLFDSDRDLGRPNVKDVPCTLSIQFFLRDGAFGPEPEDVRKYLQMWVVMRSNDAWLGLPYDLGQFSLLQFAIAQALGAEIGTYTHTVGSMHLYERNWEAAGNIGYGTADGWSQNAYGSFDIAEIASRCRRILLGETLTHMTNLEAWLTNQIRATR